MSRAYYAQHLIPAPPESVLRHLRPLANKLGLSVLPDHLHVIIGSTVFYIALFWLSPYLFKDNKYYKKYSHKTQINWDIHFVSMVQCIIICTGALWVFNDPYLADDSVFGYSAMSADVFSMGTGYFLYDVYVSLRYINEFGMPFAIHGIASLLVFIFALVWHMAQIDVSGLY